MTRGKPEEEAAILQLENLLRHYPDPDYRVDIRGVIIDYVGRRGKTLKEILEMNGRLHDLFMGADAHHGEALLKCLLPNEDDAKQLASDCQFVFPGVSDLIAKCITPKNMNARYLNDPVALLENPAKFLERKLRARIWQLSDIHFGKLNKLEANPRELAFHLSKTANEYPAIKPDIIIVSGDVTSVAATEEFAAFKIFCETLGKALWGKPRSDRFLVIPGNHDTTWKADGTADRMSEFVKSVSDGGFCITPFGRAHEELAGGSVQVTRVTSDGDTPPVAHVYYPEFDLDFLLLVSSYFSGEVPEAYRSLLPAAGVNREEFIKLLRRDEGAINREYIHNITTVPRIPSFMQLGVTHHNPIQFGLETCVNRLAPLLLETLFKNGTKILLHGHTHLIEDRGSPRPVPSRQSYPIPAPTLCSDCVAGSKGFLIHFIGEDSQSKTFDTVVWEVSASSNFTPNQIRIGYRFRLREDEVELAKGK